ncbi:MAG: Na+/H+ antiporter subunit E [Candidatus Saganbacteria bacterium]|nr:Na+/H+ antiporter subunit E [Candidatus Saganbacteria bacterium]
MKHKMRGILSRILETFSALLIIWFLFTFSLDPFSVLLGVIFSFVISLLTYDLFVDRERVFKKGMFDLVRFLFSYVIILLFEIYIASIYLVYQVITMKINPGFVRIKTQLKSDFAQAILANSITLTPGTVTIDVENDNLYVHWLAVSTDNEQKAAKSIKERYESWLKKVFH